MTLCFLIIRAVKVSQRLLYNTTSCLNIISYKTLANTVKISAIYPYKQLTGHEGESSAHICLK